MFDQGHNASSVYIDLIGDPAADTPLAGGGGGGDAADDYDYTDGNFGDYSYVYDKIVSAMTDSEVMAAAYDIGVASPNDRNLDVDFSAGSGVGGGEADGGEDWPYLLP